MSDNQIRLHMLRGEEEQTAVFDWWARLTGHETAWNGKSLGSGFAGGTRAVLRRAGTPDDALLTEGFRHLWFALPAYQRKPWNMAPWGCVAAVL